MQTKPKANANPWLPYGERILVLPKQRETKEERKTVSGILLPDTVEEKKKDECVGDIVAVSVRLEADSKVHPAAAAIKVGATVLYSRTGNDAVRIGGIEHVLVPIENVLAIRS